MTRHRRLYIAIAIIWAASLGAVRLAAQSWTQARMYRPLPEPKVMSGPDVGFRVEGMYGDVPTGTVVLRVNGQWVEARIGGPPFQR